MVKFGQGNNQGLPREFSICKRMDAVSSKNTKHRVLIVTNMYPHAGRSAYGSFVHSQVQDLRALGYQIEVYFFPGYRNRIYYLLACFKVLYKTFIEKYDIVHAHYGLSGIPALFSWRTPVVVTFHGSDVLVGRLQPFISRIVSRLSTANIAVSAKIHKIVRGAYIPCGININAFRPGCQSSARELLGLEQNIKLILFPFDPVRKVKRYELAEAAVRILQQTGINVKLLVVHGLANEQMPDYFNACDALILTSSSEGSPTCVKEAIACGLPVVSVKVGDVGLLLENIPNSYLCEDEPEALAVSLFAAICEEKRSVFRREDLDKFDADKIAQRIARVYDAVLI